MSETFRLPTGIAVKFHIYANAAWKQRVYIEGLD